MPSKSKTTEQTVKAIGFLSMVTSGKIAEAYKKYVAPSFKHHNPYYPGDRESLQKGMEENEVKFPGKKFTVKQTIEEGDRVGVHSHVKLNAELEFATVHIFRFKDGLVVELWDLAQPFQKDSPNKNGMF